MGGALHFWELATAKETAPVRAAPTSYSRANLLHHFTVSGDGKRVAALDADWGVWVWEALGEKPVLRLPGSFQHRSITFSPDSSVLLTTHDDNVLRLWDPARGKQLRQVGPLPHDANPVFSPDGKLLAAFSFLDGVATLGLWDTATWKELRRVPWQGNGYGGLAFSADSRFILTQHLDKPAAGDDHREAAILRLWDVARGKEIRQYFGHYLGTDAVAFSPDGRMVAGSIGRSIHIWEVISSRERGRFTGHRAAIHALTFADCRRLISGSADHTAIVWDLARLASDDRRQHAGQAVDSFERLWTELAGRDASQAYRSIWSLVAGGDRAVAFLKKRLQPAAPGDVRQIAGHIAALNSPNFAVRQKASQALEALAELAAPSLRKALERNDNLELRRRLEQLLEKLDAPVTSPEQLRTCRVIEVLELIGTEDGRHMLEFLATGAAEAYQTQEARAALGRLR